MNKFIKVFILIILMSTSVVLYKSNKFDYEKAFVNQEKVDNSQEIRISTIYREQTQQRAFYEDIKEILEEYNCNLYYNYEKTIDNTVYYIKYVYIADENCVPNMELVEGRNFYNNEMESEKYISTTKIEDDLQIGRLAGYGKNTNFIIKPLHCILEDGVLLNGNFTLVMQDENKLETVASELNEIPAFNVEISDTSFLSYNRFPFGIIIFLEYILLAIFILYEIVTSYNKIAIKKLNGYSGITIWFEYIKEILIFQIIISFIVCITSVVLFFGDMNTNASSFTLSLAKMFSIEIIISFVVISLPFVYLKNIKIVDLLKKMNKENYVFVFNLIFKFVLSLIIVVLLSNSVTFFQMSFARYKETYGRWEETKKYYIIPTGYNMTAEYLHSEEYAGREEELYKLLNPDGAILADFSSYLDNYDKYYKENDYTRQAIVNPNYLIKNDVYDVNGEKVVIDESDEDYIILVNEKFMPIENEILEHTQFIKEAFTSKVKNQDIRIIWVKDNQSLFSYNIEIELEKNNMIDLNVVKVLTLENGDMRDYDRIIGYQGHPFKIYVEDGVDVYEYLKPKTDEVGLSKHIEKVYSVYDDVNEEIENAQDIFLYQLGAMVTLVVCIVLSIYQNIYLYIRNNMKKIFTKTINGHSFVSKYYKYYVQQIVSWSLLIGMLVLVGNINNFVLFDEQNIVLCTISICVLEFFISLICFFILEKKSIASALKGGVWE